MFLSAWLKSNIKIITVKNEGSLLIMKNRRMRLMAIFAAGVLFGTAGIKILTSKDAKKLYTNCTAAVLRAKSCIMKTATTVQENCEDIYADAKTINETKYNTEEVVLDSVDEDEEA